MQALKVLREFDAAGVEPQSRQVVKFAGFAVEDVNDEIAVIEQHPFGGFVTLDSDGARFELLLYLLAYLVGDCLDLPLVGGGGDDEELCKTGDRPQVERDHIECFFIGGAADGELYLGVKFCKRRGRLYDVNFDRFALKRPFLCFFH